MCSVCVSSVRMRGTPVRTLVSLSLGLDSHSQTATARTIVITPPDDHHDRQDQLIKHGAKLKNKLPDNPASYLRFRQSVNSLTRLFRFRTTLLADCLHQFRQSFRCADRTVEISLSIMGTKTPSHPRSSETTFSKCLRAACFEFSVE